MTKTKFYALNLDPGDKRILSATNDQYGADGQPRVDHLPDSNITDYKYIDGQYVYDPIPEPTEPTEPTAEEDMQEMIVDHEYRLTLLELGITE